MQNLPLLLCASRRLPEVLAVGATLEMSPDTPSSPSRARVSSALEGGDMTKVWLVTLTAVRMTGAHTKFCAAAAAVKPGALTNPAVCSAHAMGYASQNGCKPVANGLLEIHASLSLAEGKDLCLIQANV